MQKIIRILMVTAMLVPFVASAAELISTPGAELIKKLTDNKVTVMRQFQAVLDLKGYVVQDSHCEKSILFTDAQGQYLIAGNIVDADGRSLVQQYTDEYINAGKGIAAYKGIDKTHWISEGKDAAKHKIYIVVDTNCYYCKRLHEVVQPFIDAGDLQVRWIMVAIGPDSKGKSAHILSAKTNAEAVALIKENEDKFDEKTGRGGISALSDDGAAKQAFVKVADNTAFLTNNHFAGTPVVLYKDMSGAPKAIPGCVDKQRFKAMLDTISDQW